MIRTIWKFPLDVARTQHIAISRVHRFLDLQLQNDVPTLWVLVIPDSNPVEVRIDCFGTGLDGPDMEREYLGTVQQGEFVWHYFRGPESE